MKRLSTSIMAITVMLGASAMAGEENIRVTVQTFSLSHESLTELMETTEGKDPQIHKQAVALSRAGKAKQLNTIMVTARQGSESEAQAVQEYIYPTEYDPPELQMSGSPTNGNFYEGGIPDGSGIPSCLNPTAFETRFLGTDLSTSSVILQKGLISSQAYASFDSFVRLESHFKHKDNWGKVDLKMPVFDSWSSSSSWTSPHSKQILKPSTFTLLATHRPSNADATTFKDSRVLIFIRADIIDPEAE